MNYQETIVNDLKNGARLQCTEGGNYKCWIVYPDGKTRNVRRDSAERVCRDYDRYLIFGEWAGIRWYTTKDGKK